MSNLSDLFALDLKSIGNQLVSNAVTGVIFEYSGVADRIFSNQDNPAIAGLKFGALVTAVSAIGSKARLALPMMNVF